MGNQITYQLREYQKALIAEIFHQWQIGNRRVMAQLPTGGGKTIVFGSIAREFVCRDEVVLVLAHREELIVQAADKVGAIARAPVGIIKAGYKPSPHFSLQVASVQTLSNRLSLLENVSLIIVDEAHHSPANTYRKILEAYPDAYQLGVTATPLRLDGTGFRDRFDVLVCGPGVGQLIKDRYLCPFRLFADPNPMKTAGVKTVNGDYSVSGIAAANDVIELSGNLLKSYRDLANGKRCVVFAVNVSHSQAIASRYNEAGIRSYHLDAATPEGERREVLERFRRGEIKVLTNCQLFDEGLDIPALEAVQVAKPTKSLTRWLQMVGRGLRSSSGKDYAILLDHTKNWAIHGLPTRPRLWTLDGVEEISKLALSRQQLTGEVTEEEIVETQLELAEIDTNVDTTWQKLYDELVLAQKINGYKKAWIYYQLLELKPPLEIWQQYASYQGYKPGWAYYRFKEQQQPTPQEIWESVFKHLPPLTRTLICPYCQLVGLEKAKAYIGVKNEAFLRLIQSKLGELEAAFEVVCHQKIQVFLQVKNS